MPVVVVVEKDTTPGHPRVVGPRGHADVVERAVPVVHEHRAGVEVGDVQVQVAVVVDVSDVHTHAVALVVQPRHEGQIQERAVPLVAVKLVGLVGVVGQVEVLVPVVVVIEEDASHADARVEGACGAVHVGEPCPSVVAVEVVHGVDVDHIEVRESVVVVVRCVQASAHQCAVEAVRFSHVHEGAVPLVDVEPVRGGIASSKAIARGQVEVSIVVEVKPDRRIGESLVRHPGLFCDVGERHVAVVAVQAVGLEFRADVDVFVSIAVVVAHSHAMVLAFRVEPGRCTHVDKGGGGLAP